MLQALVWRSRCLKQDDLAPKTISLTLCWSPPPHVTEHFRERPNGSGAFAFSLAKYFLPEGRLFSIEVAPLVGHLTWLVCMLELLYR